MTKRYFSQPHRTERHIKLLEAQHQTLHEWWGVKAAPLDAETAAKVKEGLRRAWEDCK